MKCLAAADSTLVRRVAPALLVAATFGHPSQAATITVEIASDDPAVASCTLRDAISAANADSATGACPAGSGDDTIEFLPGLAGQTIVLDNTGAFENANVTGDLDVDDPDGDSLTITGPGAGDAASIVIDGNSADRVMQVASPLALHNLTVRNGAGVNSGAGISTSSGGVLDLVDVVVSDNVADGGSGSANGGGVFARASLTLDRAAITNNTVTSSGGSAIGGGLILQNTGGAAADLVIRDSTIRDNSAMSATGFAGGGGLRFQDLPGGMLTLDDTVVSGNRATGMSGEGGGIEVVAGSAAELRRVELSDNHVVTDGGSADGGGIWSRHDTHLVNVTVSGNSAEDGTGGDVAGGGIRFFTAMLELDNTTVTNNEVVTSGTAGGSGVDAGSGTAVSRNTLIAGNAGGGTDCAGALESGGWTLMGDVHGCLFTSATGDLVGDSGGSGAIEPMLGPLTDNGGATRTHALMEGSPAIDAGNPNPVMDGTPPACPTSDQRGEPRPDDGDADGAAVCDIGAYEGVVTAASTGGGGGGGALTGRGLGLLALLVLCRVLGCACGEARRR